MIRAVARELRQHGTPSFSVVSNAWLESQPQSLWPLLDAAVAASIAHRRDEALQLIEFLRARDAELMRANERTAAPQDLELYALPTVLRPYPQSANLNRNGSRLVARPSVVSGQKYEQVSRAYMEQVHSVLTGNKQAPAAAAELAKQLEGITGFRPGPPVKPGAGMVQKGK